MNATQNTITDKYIFEKAPAVFGIEKAPERTERYEFLSTADIKNIFQENNWFPHIVSQVRVQKRTIARKDYAKHLITFTNPDLPTVNGVFPQIALVNSHDGYNSLKMMAGLYRLICANGLIVSDSEFETIVVRHNHYAHERITEGINNIIDLVPKIVAKTEAMRAINMKVVDQMNYAENVMKRIWVKDDSPFTSAQLIKSRRNEDFDYNLWNTYNRVQENLVRGGLMGRTKNGKIRKMKGITNITKTVNINKILWEEADNMLLAA